MEILFIVVGTLSCLFLWKRLAYSSYKKSNVKGVPEDERIYHELCCYEFPWECFYGINFAFYRTFSSPSISGLYYKTGTIEKTTEKRVDDTDILMHAWADYGIDSRTGSESWKHLNRIHGAFAGKTFNRDFVYVLCCFVVDTIRFIELFGWRSLSEQEKQGIYTFWAKVGDRMEIKDIPTSLKGMNDFVTEYVESDETSKVTDGGKALTEAITILITRWYWFVPEALVRPCVGGLLYSIGGETFGKKLGLPKPHPMIMSLFYVGGWIRGLVMNFFPPRTSAHQLSKLYMYKLYNPHAAAMNFSVVGPPSVISNFGKS